MSSDGRYSESVGHAIAVTKPGDGSEATILILELAHECDRLQVRLTADANEMSRKFAEFAQKVANGWRADSPNGWSTLRDVDQGTATFQAKVDCLGAMVRAHLGSEGAKQFRAALEARTVKA